MVIAKADYATDFESGDELQKMNGHNKLNNIIGEKVKIKVTNKEGINPEDYYYLKKFENQKGTISEQSKCKSGKYTYKVIFDQNNFGYFYCEDFILIDEDKPR